jgi:hypothetical protein
VPSSLPEDGTNVFTLRFLRVAGDLSTTVVVHFSISGSAGFDSDYTILGADSWDGSTGSVTLLPYSAEQVVLVDPVADSAVEDDETVVITINSSPGNYLIGTASTTLTIQNDDTNLLALASVPDQVPEPEAQTEANEDDPVPPPVIMQFVFTRQGDLTNPLEVSFQVGGTAVYGEDYVYVDGALSFSASAGSIIIPLANTQAALSLQILSDYLIEGAETIVLTINAAPRYIIKTEGGIVGTILDNAPTLPVISLLVQPTAVSEGSRTAVTLRRTGVMEDVVIVYLTVQNTRALYPQDYALSGVDFEDGFTSAGGQIQVLIGKGQTEEVFYIDVVDDNLIEQRAEFVDLAVVYDPEEYAWDIQNNHARIVLLDNDFMQIGLKLDPKSTYHPTYIFTLQSLDRTSTVEVQAHYEGTAVLDQDFQFVPSAGMTYQLGSGPGEISFQFDLSKGLSFILATNSLLGNIDPALKRDAQIGPFTQSNPLNFTIELLAGQGYTVESDQSKAVGLLYQPLVLPPEATPAPDYFQTSIIPPAFTDDVGPILLPDSTYELSISIQRPQSSGAYRSVGAFSLWQVAVAVLVGLLAMLV